MKLEVEKRIEVVFRFDLDLSEEVVKQVQKRIRDEKIDNDYDLQWKVFERSDIRSIIEQKIKEILGEDALFFYDHHERDSYEHEFKLFKKTCCDEWERFEFCLICGKKIKK